MLTKKLANIMFKVKLSLSANLHMTKSKLLIAKQQLDLINRLYNNPKYTRDLNRIFTLEDTKLFRRNDVYLVLYINNLSNIINRLGKIHDYAINQLLNENKLPSIKLVGFDYYYRYKFLEEKLNK